MGRLAIAIAAIAVVGTPSFAADMGAPPPAPAPVYNWSGWYAGVNAGASFGHVETDFNVAHSTANVFFQDSFQGSFPAPNPFLNKFAGSDTTYPSGFMGGGQIGYNWQFSPNWVVGFEADFQGALEKDSSTITRPFLDGTQFGLEQGSRVLAYQTKIEWFGTVRGRIGYVWGNGAVMSYVTGGLAYGKVDLEGTSTVDGTVAGGRLPFSVTQAIGHSKVNTGWVLGYGTEGKLLIPGWTYRIESLYMDLGTLDATGGGSSNTTVVTIQEQTAAIATTAGQVTTRSHFTNGILRLGLNYQFH